MKKYLSLLYIALSLAGFSSCSEDLEVPRGSGMAGAIRFGLVQDNATKGIGTTSTNFLSQIKDFQVWAYFDGTATGEGITPGALYFGESDTEGTFINGDGKGTWSYRTESHLQYWPATTAPLNFQAITPATDASFTISNTPADDLSHLTAVVNVPTDVKLQKDIMFAKADKQTYESNANCVSLVFKHGLSQVVFNGRLGSDKITAQVSSIEIVNVHSKGNVGYFASDASLGSEVTGVAETTYSVGLVDEPTLESMDSKSLTSADGALLMLPQEVTAWATSAVSPVSTSEADAAHNSYLKVKCTVTDNTSGTVLISDEYVYIPFEISWEQGKKYIYTLVFGGKSNGYDENGEIMKNMLPISYTIQRVEDWEEVVGNEHGIGVEITIPLVTATFNATAGSSTRIYYGDLSKVSTIYIDEEEVSPTGEYTFSTDGEHTVSYAFADPTIIPDNSFYQCSNLSSIVIPKGVKNISYKTFYYCSNLSSVEFPEGLSTIGQEAFYNCTSLEKLSLPEGLLSIGNNAFCNCKLLPEVKFPSTLSSIGACAFYNCSALTSVTIGSGVKSIGEFAFQGCSGLTSIVVEDGNPVYDSREGCNAIIETSTNILVVGCKNTAFPNSITKIGDYAFSGTGAPANTVIPEGVTSIGDYAFSSCKNLNITLPESLTKIGERAFSNSSFSSSISIPSSVKSIGKDAFYYASGSSLTVLEGVTSIDDYAFNECRIGQIILPNGLESIGNYAFHSCQAITSLTIPEGVTSVGDYAIQNCVKLDYLKIPSTLEYIPFTTNYYLPELDYITVASGNPIYDSRGGCNALIETSTNTLILGARYVNIPEGITSIGERAFYDRNRLTSITLPQSLLFIADNAFGLSRIKNITSKARVAPTLGVMGKPGFPSGGTLTVPVGATGYDTWIEKLSGWTIVYSEEL